MFRAAHCIATISLCLLLTTASHADDPPTRGEALFAHRVLPVFREKCFACHGEDAADVRGDFNMLSRETLLRGGESEEPAVIPGKPDDSQLLQAIRWESLEMPPKENDRLNEEQIASVHEWIQRGAPWPDKERLAEVLRSTFDEWNASTGTSVATSGGLSAEWTERRYEPENLWAYRPLTSDRPQKRDGTNLIDEFIAKQAADLKVAPAAPADRRTLIRRATFDLTGLPPTPEAVQEFERDPGSDEEAFGRLVERLLASPHYGERWGRHWLDVVRYADSSGFANDFERGNAWRYRDYVVRAFNTDKPYDEFIREQLAGDEIDAGDPELLIATGFLRMGPWELTGMEVAKVARQRFLDDVTDIVGQVFLGHMLQCARCHDHKFDPVPTRDYYSIQAAFATTQIAERSAAFLPDENVSGFDEKRYLLARKQSYQQTLRDVEKKQTLDAARHWYRENGLDASLFETVVAELSARSPNGRTTVAKVRNALAARKADPATIPPRHVGFEPSDLGMERVARKGLQRLVWRMERYEPYALSVYAGRSPRRNGVYAPVRVPEKRLKVGELELTSILTGGDPFSPGERVQPGVLSAVSAFTGQSPTPIPRQIVGRRRALADWIASTENPLTARVMVNRIWQWHFGQAIAGNPNNFGTTGRKPTHPQLLNWLAARFIEDGWSVKSLHRLIMNSDAYRRASSHPDAQNLAANDPNGVSYAVFRPRRLEAEEIRDAMLSVSGELNPTLGGIPVRPEINREAALQPRQVMGTFAEAWQPSPLPEQRHRRSLYALQIRGLSDPFMGVFNAPGPDLSCETRDTSTVTPQVFALFNSEMTYDRALALADRVLQQHKEDAALTRVFQLCYGRNPQPAEQRACVEHWRRMTARHQTLTFDPPTYPTEVLRHAVEENTGERFSFTEPLEVAADFVPDLKPSSAPPRVRGLAEVCLVLLNSNEFLYVY